MRRPLADLAPLLVALGEKVGIRKLDWLDGEDWSRIKVEATVEASRVGELEDQLFAALAACGDSLSARLGVQLEDVGTFDLADWDTEQDPVERASLDVFLGQFASFPDLELRLTLRLDKLAYAETLVPDRQPATRVTLFAFPEALATSLSTFEGLRQLDEQWGDDPEERWLCLLPAWRAGRPAAERLLSGPHLTLFGGDPGELPALEAGAAETSSRRVRELRDEQLRWESRWLARLTPFHLALHGEVEAADPVVAPLRLQFALLAVLYTADRVRGGDGAEAKPAVAVYQGAERRLEVRCVEPGEVCAGLGESELEGVAAWDRLCRWCYSREGSVGDRLAMVQNVVCREAWGAEPQGAFRVLLERGVTILDQVRHGWKSFIEGKVDTFFTQLQSLEETVAETVRGVAGQTGKLVGQLSTTVLAGVGVLLGALLLPLLKEGDFEPWVLAVGMVVYAMYVLVFPVLFGLLSQWQAQRALQRGFDERYERFRRQLPAHLVEGVGRHAVDHEVRRFRYWFGAVLVTYALLVLGLYAGGVLFGLRALGWR